jgi:hypothetical protein
MKRFRIITFFISLLLSSVSLISQNDIDKETKKDSLPKKELKYGIRVGVDMAKLARTAFSDNYSGFEILADYRFSKKFFIAGEIGSEQKDFESDYLDVTTKGNYLKAGVDYNMHNNLFPLDNMIYTGFRVGYANFTQTINESTVYTVYPYWQPTPANTNQRDFNNLSAIWVEIQFGIKAEVLNNLYLGVNAQLKHLVSEDQPENFANLYIPGFNKVFEGAKIGAGFGYSISYRIPVYKK